MPLLPWKWGSGSQEREPSGNGKERESEKKRRVRTRAEQVAEAAQAHSKKDREKEKSLDADVVDAYFPGLVNMSGTHCFMNSTLQALASLSTLPPYLLAIRTRAEALDVPTPVVDALIDLLAALNTPSPTAAQPLRAVALVEALASTNLGASAKATALLASHEHQDAQELFQLLSECVREEGARVVREGARDRGLGFASALALPSARMELGTGPSPFDGLTATRRACVRCGYTAAIRHFAFDSVQLALEGGWSGTSLPALLRAYTALEVLQDCPCRRCALRATARRLQEEIARLEAPATNGHENGMIVTADAAPTSASRLRRLKTARKMEARLRRALEAGRIEEEDLEGEWDWDGAGAGVGEGKAKGGALAGLRIERVAGGVCTRQSMLGRPPAVLVLHLNRSMHTGIRVAKNGARVAFPEILDLAPYTTGGVLSLDPTAALSGSLDPNGIAFPSPDTPAPSTSGAGTSAEECLYRLAAVVCHYGAHSFGHYICYRRAPVPPPPPPSISSPSSPSPSATPPSAQAYAPAPPTAQDSAGTGTGWLRISDARVDRVGVETVLAEGSAAFMLYYER
ncbi:hypothetical protein C8R45DRAFT_840408, partial [Mycena sanguinolenta]